MHHAMHWGTGIWPVFPLIWLGLLVFLGCFVARRCGWRTRRAPFSQLFDGDAMEILRRRYARGDIDGPTFDQMRERLEGTRYPRD